MNPPDSAFDDVLTTFCDHDEKWGPALFLRPRRDQPLGVARTVALAAFPGVLLGLIGSILLLLAARTLGRTAPPVYAFPIALTCIYYAVCRLTIVPAWNRRAQRMSRPDE